MFNIPCRCGKTSKNFKNDLGIAFYIDDCCEKAGYDEKGNKKEGLAEENQAKEIQKKEQLKEEYNNLSNDSGIGSVENLEIKDLEKMVNEKKEALEKAKNESKVDIVPAPKESEAYNKQEIDLKIRLRKAEKSLMRVRSNDKKLKVEAEILELKQRLAELKK